MLVISYPLILSFICECMCVYIYNIYLEVRQKHLDIMLEYKQLILIMHDSYVI